MEPALEIKVLEHDATVGAIPITWCISKEKMFVVCLADIHSFWLAADINIFYPPHWNEPVTLIPCNPRPSKWAARWWPFRVKILEIRLWLKRLKRGKALSRISY